MRSIKIESAQVVEVGDGGITLRFDGDLIAEVPCSNADQAWAGAHLYRDVEVQITITPKPEAAL